MIEPICLEIESVVSKHEDAMLHAASAGDGEQAHVRLNMLLGILDLLGTSGYVHYWQYRERIMLNVRKMMEYLMDASCQ